ncbi:hypothetical protein ABZX98_07825 [Streptomyces sp. NPDC002992]|uniref:hypothetical protein n=1 Tax=Streptomyces sp. NPDC002992 TaxID=3154273 RepID=UPI0033A8D66D
MFGRRKAKKDQSQLGPAGVPWLNHPAPQWPGEQQPAPEETGSEAAVDDLPPADLRLDLDRNRFMIWRRPLVIDGEVRACPTCESYRDWAILATQGRVWLRCSAGHVTPEPRLDIAWYNRHCGPTDATFDTLEEGLSEYGL